MAARLQINDVEIDRDGRRLSRAGTAVAVQPKVFELLLYLLDRRNRVVEKDELLSALWGTEAVVPGVLTTAMGALRRALGDTAKDQRFVRTVPGAGYQFVATVGDKGPRAAVAESLHRSFIGRDRELALFDAMVKDPASALRMLYVHGPGGIGKTSLVQEFEHRSQLLGVRTVRLDAEHMPARPEAVRTALEQALASNEAGRITVVFIDNFDMLVGLSRWFREVLWPSVSDSVRFVVAARSAPDARWRADRAWRSTGAECVLQPFDEQEAERFLTSHGIGPDHLRAVVIFTAGHPLALAVASEALERGADPSALPTDRLVIDALVETFTDRTPSPAHRRALEAACLLSSFDEGLLAELLEQPDVGELYAWLSRLSFVARISTGLQLHELVRRAVLAQLRFNDSARLGAIAARCYQVHFDLLASATSVADEMALTVRLMSLGRHNPVLRPYYAPDHHLGLHLDVGVAIEEHEAVCAIIRRYEGSAAAGLAARWLTSDRALLSIVRDDAEHLAGFTIGTRVRVAELNAYAWDPAIECVREHLSTRSDWSEDDEVLVYRWLVATASYQEVTPVLQRCHEVLNYELHTMPESVAYSFNVYGDPATWEVVNGLANHERVDAAFEVDGRRYGLFAHSWREQPREAWVRSIIAKLSVGSA